VDEPEAPDSFGAFRESFAYGERNDLNFKFMKSMTDAEAASFLQKLLHQLGDTYDTGDAMPLIETAYRTQVDSYSPAPDVPPSMFTYADGPLAPVQTSLRNARVGLLTASGHFVSGDDPNPFGEIAMTQERAIERSDHFLSSTPLLSEIPVTTPATELRVRHAGYDIRSSLKDPNVTFPIDRMKEARDNGTIGGLASTFFSFPGITVQGRLRNVLPQWVERIHEEDVDVMLLVPV